MPADRVAAQRLRGVGREGPVVDWLPAGALSRDLPLRDQTYRLLREAIVTARVAPGALLHEPSIAERFGVSRTPVREALLRLADEGLVIIWRQSGTYVAEVDPQRVEEAMLVRETLEPRVVELAAVRADEDLLSSLTQATDRMEAASSRGDSAAFLKADDEFHACLLDASGYPNVSTMIGRVNAQLDRIRYLSVSEPERAATAVAEHRQLVAHLRAGDGGAAGALLRTHLEGSWVLLRAWLER